MDDEKEIDRLMEMDGITKNDWLAIVLFAAFAFVLVYRP